jgi:hypothetical protein
MGFCANCVGSAGYADAHGVTGAAVAVTAQWQSARSVRSDTRGRRTVAPQELHRVCRGRVCAWPSAVMACSPLIWQ